MRITFIVDGTARVPVGGHKMIYEYANRLADHHDVAICFRCDRTLEGRVLPVAVKHAVAKALVRIRPTWFPLSRRVKRLCVFSVDDTTVPDADCVFATAVETAEAVSNLSASKGKKCYFIQGYETWAMDEAEVKATYCLGMNNIVVSSWLRGIVEEASGLPAVLISNPVDTDVFFESDIERDACSVAALFHSGEHKGFDDLWAALLEVKKRVPGLTVHLFGTFPEPKGLPEWCSYTRNATTTQLRAIYNRSMVFACASKNEGFGLTCLEAMACGCVLVATEFQGVKDYAVSGWNAYTVPISDRGALAEGIVLMLTDDALRERISANARHSAVDHSWENAMIEMEKAIR